MPTAYPRSQITQVPRVQRIVRIGSARWPGRSAGDILVNLAEERAEQLAREGTEGDPLAGLVTIRPRGRAITHRMVEDALLDD
jgi:hypothetical protein